MTGRRVTVLGAGVIGLSVAAELAAAGCAVTVVADRDGPDTVSAVAAAVWFPYRSASPSLATWLARSLARFTELAGVDAAGVDLREGIVVERRPDADRSWTAGLTGARPAPADELPPDALSGVRAELPVVTMSRYLPWLRSRCAAAGVAFQHRTVGAVGELAPAADLVVVAAGLRSGELLGDDSLYPVRGQVVRVADPGLTRWVIDDDHPDGLAYVVPRRDDVVCGGTAAVGSWDPEPDPATERAVLRRTAELVPALAGQPVLSRAVGLRPGRDAVRLEPVGGHAVPVIACYGHGGSGVTLSWGCAEAVAALVAHGPDGAPGSRP